MKRVKKERRKGMEKYSEINKRKLAIKSLVKIVRRLRVTVTWINETRTMIPHRIQIDLGKKMCPHHR